ncbi:hypothetical protein BCR34DRAFT_606229 [Clohesyomyces aquaticus]|uniref:Uncharacterized protein n=1 Tax=Clohesyomyces aquaticus TaxID=1231657 RepID=A0A1Y1YRF1_9PLEO|nr:hypothetical protein BCR34DRAFT_606229 [Clohesyomyces aquaticus]
MSSFGSPDPKRPPTPVKIPLPPPPRMTPGPNAFAIAEAKAKAERKLAAGEVHPALRPQQQEDHTPVSTPLDETIPRGSESQARGEDKSASHLTTISQLMKMAGTPSRKSDLHSTPCKSDQYCAHNSDQHNASRNSDQDGASRKSGQTSTSTSSRYGAMTARSRHSQRSQRSAPSTRPGDEDTTLEFDKTSRFEMEARNEGKLFKIMGQIPPTLSSVDSNSGVTVQKFDYTKAAAADKSPKKKIFGMSIPSFRSSGTTASAIPPPMPSKAAKLFGTSLAPERLQETRAPKPVMHVQSKTSKSLPSQYVSSKPLQYGPYSHRSHNHRPSHHRAVRLDRAASRTPTLDLGLPWQSKHDEANGASQDGHTPPPTPPDKDTPPSAKGLVSVPLFEMKHTKIDSNEQVYEVEIGDEMTANNGLGIALFMKPASSNEKENHVPSSHGLGRMVTPDPIKSSHGSLHAQFGYIKGRARDGRHSAPFEYDEHPYTQAQRGHWSEDDSKRLMQMGHELSPAFYTPSNFSVEFDASVGRPSANKNPLRYFLPKSNGQGQQPIKIGKRIRMPPGSNTIEIEEDSQAKPITLPRSLSSYLPPKEFENMNLQDTPTSEAQDSPAQRNGASQLLPPEKSSSRLMDMLDGVSPNKTGYNVNFYAKCPSAVPSPLYADADQRAVQMPPPPMALPVMSPQPVIPGTLSDGSNILTHFHMTNAHFDVLGCSLHDTVTEAKEELTTTAKKCHIETVLELDQRFAGLKEDLRPLGQNVDGALEQTRNINGKLDQLADFIKSQVIDPLAAQSKKTDNMEKDIKSLVKTMQDMQKSMEAKANTTSTLSQPGHALLTQQPSFPLPNHRSQPSLTGYYDSPGDVGRAGAPPVPDLRNDGRFRYGTNNSNYYHASKGLENKDDNHQYGSPYGSNAATYNGGYMGGYPGYYQGVANQQN